MPTPHLRPGEHSGVDLPQPPGCRQLEMYTKGLIIKVNTRRKAFHKEARGLGTLYIIRRCTRTHSPSTHKKPKTQKAKA